MSADDRPLWTRLGLDLQKHDLLQQALAQMYAGTFLPQANRPAGMA